MGARVHRNGQARSGRGAGGTRESLAVRIVRGLGGRIPVSYTHLTLPTTPYV